MKQNTEICGYYFESSG